MSWVSIIIFSILAESIVETLKPIWDVTKRADLKDKLIVLGISIMLTLLVGVDIFAIAKVPILAWSNVNATVSMLIGSFLTGIIVSRGANWIHDLVKKLVGVVVPKPE